MARSLACSVLLILLATSASAGDVLFEGRFARIDTDQVLPQDLILPEGKTRWDFAGVELREVRTRKFIDDPGNPGSIERVEWLTDAPELVELRTRIADPTGGNAALRWLRPQEDPFLLKVRAIPEIRLDEGPVALRIETRRVGMGWLLLPSGPHEIVLQRAWVRPVDSAVEAAGAVVGRQGHGTLIHRWIDTRAGEVARIWGPASQDGTTRLSIDGAEVAESIVLGGNPLKLYVDQVEDLPCGPPPDICHSRLAYGYVREMFCENNGDPCVDSGGCGLTSECVTAVSGLTSPSYSDMGSLIAAGNWDFSPNDSTNDGAILASIASRVSPAETCNSGQCGFVPGLDLGREDKFEHLGGTVRRTLSVVEKEEPAGGPTTIWLRGGTNNEELSGGLGSGESRFCFDPAEGYTPVPLWQFQSEDPEGWYMELGDVWSSDSFDCEQNIFNHVCPSDCDQVTFCKVYAGTHPIWCNDRDAKQHTTMVAEGPVTLPSGHTFQSLVARNVSEFCVWLDDDDCSGFLPSRVRTVIYMWQVPYLGTVARLVSRQNGPADYVSFSDVAEADIKFGLFPPVSVSIDATADDAVQLSWNPGTETDEIDGYAVHWGPTSGASGPYENRTPQLASAGVGATIGGLLAGTQYFFTVTSLSDHENPATSVTKTYESLIFPLSIEANGGGFIPVEVSATTTCTGGVPPVEIEGLTVDRPSDTEVEVCWTPSPNTCITGYEILGATSPESPTDFSVLATHSGPGNCHTLNHPTEDYFLVRATGSGGPGPS